MIFYSIISVSIFVMTQNVYAESIEAQAAYVDEEIELSSYIVYSGTVSDIVLDLKNDDSLTSKLIVKTITGIDTTVSAAASSNSYNLNDYYDIEVKDQGDTNSCWAFAILSSTETNIQINLGKAVTLSAKHMNYATSTSFADGVNSYAFARAASDGGSTLIGLAYLTNGQGAVLESEMPYTDDTSDISISEIDIDPSYYVTGYDILPTIYKLKKDGELYYTDGYGTYYTDNEVEELREIIKEHIVTYGGISAYTAANASAYYNSDNILEATAYYLDTTSIAVDHAVTIVGWDDNYSKENFTGAAKPSSDGAYIVLNSYSDEAFDDGYIYISYEDVWIEAMLYGITSTSAVDYDNIYQHDIYGATMPFTLTLEGENVESGYYASIFTRDSSYAETLNEISVSSNQYAKFEVYVNTSGSDLSSSSLVKVATTGVLDPGYNTISFDDVELTGDTFAVVVKQTAIDETVYFMLEARLAGTFYDNISATAGDSKVSLDGENWVNISDLGSITYSSYSVDLATADVCIKAFTTVTGTNVNTSDDENNEEENKATLETDVYSVSSDNYITKIYHETTIDEFLNNVTLNYSYSFSKNNTTVTDYSSYVSTGMQLITNGETYNLVVRGDTNGDGKITLTDLSKQILHYVNYEGFILSGAYAKACDFNLDGNFTLTDISQIRVYYVNRTQ